MILYAKLSGQEDGNVTFVESEGVGVWAPDPLKIVRVLTYWACHPQERQKVVEACRRAARPEAASKIAHMLVEQLNLVQVSPDVALS